MKNNNLKQFISKYDIANPDWSKIPYEFPNCNISDLNYQEKIIWDAIMLAWINEHPLGYLKVKTRQTILTSATFTFIGMALLMLLYYTDVNYNLGLRFLTDFFA